MVLNLLQPVHLITTDVNEQGVAVVQLTENKRTHQLNSSFRPHKMADRVNSSDLEIMLNYWCGQHAQVMSDYRAYRDHFTSLS